MFAHLDTIRWQSCKKARHTQRLAGRVCAFFLLIALLGLLDGLQGVMRSGSDTLELLPGQSAMISGPTATKNPVNSDLQVIITPDNGLLRFVLEGFFPSYWFGSGMWRAEAQADALCPPGHYEMQLRFKGAAVRGAQKYTVLVWADETSMRWNSFFFSERLTGINPFLPAASSFILAIICGIATYLAGKRYLILLTDMDCAEIFRISKTENGVLLWCSADKRHVQPQAEERALMDTDGNFVGTALVAKQDKSVFTLHLSSDTPAQIGFLVYLRPFRQDAHT